MLDAVQKKVQAYVEDKYILPIADKRYNEEVEKWEDDISKDEKVNARNLSDPQFAASLGLPANLPYETIRVLKKTMAIDKLGPQKPKRDKLYRKFGIE